MKKVKSIHAGLIAAVLLASVSMSVYANHGEPMTPYQQYNQLNFWDKIGMWFKCGGRTIVC